MKQEKMERIQRQGRTITSETLTHVFEIHEQIKQHTNGRIFEDSTELLRQMREERSRELEER